MVPRYPPDPELTDREHSSCISCGLIEKYNLALEADSLAGVLPTGVAQKDLEKLKKGFLPPASPTAAAGCSAAVQAAGSKPEGAGDREWRLRGWLTWLRSRESSMQGCCGLHVKAGLGTRGLRLPCELGAHLLA